MLCGGCSRESHKLVSYLVQILAEELYGYSVTFVYDDNWVVSILEGIRDDKVAHPSWLSRTKGGK